MVGVWLIGIDTPEIRGKCKNEKDKAQLARRFLNSRLKSAERIILRNVGRDKYFRIGATVEANGVDMNALMVKQGLGVKYDGGKKIVGWCD